MTATFTRVDDAYDFLLMLHGNDAEGWATLFRDEYDQTDWIQANDLRTAAETAIQRSQSCNVWHGVGLRNQRQGNKRRGSEKDIASVPGLWIEIDVGGQNHGRAHTAQNLPPTHEAARDLLDAVPFHPSIVIDSGHGIQAYVLFREPYTIEGDDDRQRVRSLNDRFQSAIKARAQERGWSIDTTSDLARVLRLPGTTNHKLEPVIVRVIERDDNARYTLDYLEEMLPGEEELGWVATERKNDGDFPPADYNLIAAGCPWIAHCQDDAAALPEPSWYAQASILARCTDGDTIFHEISSCYPGYSTKETDEKLNRARLASGPRTCRYVRQYLDGEPYCSTCQYWGKITSPIVLGRPKSRPIAGIPHTKNGNGVHHMNGNGNRTGEIPPADPPDAVDNINIIERSYALTDTGNAERLVAQHGADLRYCNDWNKWLVYNRRWAQDRERGVFRRGQATVRTIYGEAAAIEEVDRRKATAKHAERSESAKALREMVFAAQHQDGVTVVPESLDQYPMLLNVENGTIDLRTGMLHPHDRQQLITKLAPVTFDQTATCPTFMAFIATILPSENDRVARFIQRAVGYSLSGVTSERSLFILHGAGANGKSTLLEVVRCLLGDYAIRTPTRTLMVKRDEGVPNDIARLRGTRFVSASETEEGQRIAESLIKDLTGGDTISARFMRGEWFDFKPEFKAWLATNHRPDIRGTDNAIWDRIKLVPFSVTIPESQRDQRLLDKLKAELPGILNWAIAGCLEWQRDGLGTPDEVKKATAAYRADMDVIAAWLADSCTLNSSLTASAGDLYASYKAWCEQSGERPMRDRDLGLRLAERGLQSRRGAKGKRLWIGIALGDAETQVTLSDAQTDIGLTENETGRLSPNVRHPASPKGLASPDESMDDDNVPF